MEGKIAMAARRQVTNKLRDACRVASKIDKGRILDEVMATTGIGRSTARRMLTGPPLGDPKRRLDRRWLRAKGYSDGDDRLRSTERRLELCLLAGLHRQDGVLDDHRRPLPRCVSREV